MNMDQIPEVQEAVQNFPKFDELHWEDQEFIKCKSSFEYFAGKYAYVLHPKRGMVNFNLYGYQRRTVKDFESYRFNIVSKFRQGGLTTLAVLWSLWRCMFKKYQTILVMSQTDGHAIVAGDIARRALEQLNHNFPWLVPELSEENKHSLKFASTSSEMMFHSPVRARGKSVQTVIIDEAAFINGMEDHWAAMYPTISTGGSVIVISTVNGRGNWYEKQYTDAQNKRNKFHIIDLDYQEHPDYSNENWVEETRSNIGEKKFAQEYLRSFLGSGETYIPFNVLAELGKITKYVYPLRKRYPEWDTDEPLLENKSLGKGIDLNQEWEKGALHIYQEPAEGKEYIIGVDVAEGVGDDGDNSAFQVLDMATLEQVAEFSSNTIRPDIFAQIIALVGNYYNTSLVVVENLGPGLAVLSKLQHTLYYENIYFQQIRSTEKAGVTHNRVTRPLILEAMRNGLINGFVKIKSNRLVRELDTFIFNRQTKKAEAMKRHHDDLVMSLAIALYIRDEVMRDVPLGVDIPENVVDSFKSETFEKLKKELSRGSPIDWAKDEKENNDNVLNIEDVLPGVLFDFKRPHDALLKEFGM